MHKRSGLVALVGRPNAGKSTLLNRLVGMELSIVSPRAQTTRERIQGVFNAPEGQIVFVDTPGLHQAQKGGINAYMVGEARASLDSPDCIWYLVGPESAIEHEEGPLSELLQLKAPVALLINKSDIKFLSERSVKLAQALVTRLSGRLSGPRFLGCFSVSARTGRGVEELLRKTWQKIPRGPALYPDAEVMSDRSVRYLAGERVREQLFIELKQEIPYSCAVSVDLFDEGTKFTRIEARIIVERDSQKGVVIGQGGQVIKRIGTAARMKIERMLGRPVYLGLKVDLMKNWTKDPESMKKLGYMV